jgi:hypothetical protein
MEPLTLTVTLDLDAHLDRFVSYDSDEAEPRTLEDVVIGEAARQIAKRVEGQAVSELRQAVEHAGEEIIARRIEAAVDAELAAGVEWTPPGKYVSERRPLDELVREQIAACLSETRDRWPGASGYGSRQTMISFLVSEVVSREVKREMEAALEEGRAAVKKALRDEGGRLLQEAIERMAAGK